MKKPTIRRIIAYILDLLIVALIASALSSTKVLNPYYDEYMKAEDAVSVLIEEASKDPARVNEIANDEEIQNLSYDISKSGIFINIYTLIISFLYFVVFQYYTKGKTLGKKILKLEVVSDDKNELKFMQLFKRSLIINSLVTTTITIILLSVLSKNSYLNYSRYVQILETALLLLAFGLVIYREDGRGLHDIFAGTRVIDSEDKEFFLKHEVKEAQIVEEKEEINKEEKPVKKTTKKSNKKKEK